MLFSSSVHHSDAHENWRERRTQSVDHRQRGRGWREGGRGTAAGRHFHHHSESYINFGGGRAPSTSWPSGHPVRPSRANRGRYHLAPRWRHFGSVFAPLCRKCPDFYLRLSSPQVVQTSSTGDLTRACTQRRAAAAERIFSSRRLGRS